ncbi:MAG: BspA family leucine-rich repeat surface protein, partial [Cyclobacteriaceae bacterium]|nr:BspA family leucine-rich repeat surface protein [Cyclobacteriaceae bacterium]
MNLLKYFLLTSCLFLSTLMVSAQDGFITTWRTTDGSITIPTTGGGYNYNITWTNLTNAGVGDGSINGRTGDYTIAGLQNGNTYRIEITGAFPRIFFNSGAQSTKIRTIEQWGNIAWQSMANAFSGCSDLIYNATDVPNLSDVTSLASMFRFATAFNGNINNWNVSNVTNMSGMFFGASSFNQPLDAWNVSNVTFMDFIFREATSFNQPLDTWNVSNVTDMTAMFEGASSFNHPLDNWDVSNVTIFANMFSSATSFNQPLNNWDVSNAINMNEMFAVSIAFNQPLDNWDVRNVTNMGRLFFIASSFNQPLDAWNVSSVTAMQEMFRNATSFNQSLASWQLNPTVNLTGILDQSGLSISSYDATLLGWSLQSVSGRTLGASGLRYCSAEARTTLVSSLGWTITGDTQFCFPTQPVGNIGLYLDGQNDFVNFGVNTAGQGGADLTIQGWIKPDLTAVNSTVISRWQDGSGSAAFALDWYGGASNSLAIVNRQGNTIISGVNTVPRNKWTHFAMVYIHATRRVNWYINGELTNSLIFDTSPIENFTTIPLRIGAVAQSGGTALRGFFKGQIDEVRIHNSARTANQIESDMQSQTADGAQAYWNFNQGTGQIVPDLGSLNVTGTLGANNLIAADDPMWAIRVKNTNDQGVESLRQAIIDANTDDDRDYIDFSIQQSEPMIAGKSTISLLSPLPNITQSIFIDGYSAFGSAYNNIPFSEGNNAQIRTEVNFAGIAAGNSGLVLNNVSNSVVRGLSLIGIPSGVGGQGALNIQGSSTNNRIEGNFIGLQADGVTIAANETGLNINGTSNVIGWEGTPDVSKSNIISGNEFYGLATGENGNIISGNYVGTDRSGTLARSNRERGIVLSNSSNSINVVNNLISGNGTQFGGGGLVLQWGTNGSIIQGNLIGTTADGTGSIPNTNNGITITGNIISGVNNNQIGGIEAGQANIIANNTQHGILIDGGSFGANGNLISGNNIYDNNVSGISLVNGGNNNKAAPIITIAQPNVISGNSEEGDIVEIFNDSPASGSTNQGRNYLGRAETSGTNWTFEGIFSVDDRITATAISINNNTSPFSTAAVVNDPLAFITTWITTDGSITIPTTGGGYNYFIAWFNETTPGLGDGSASNQTGNFTISGLTNGHTYRVEISGAFPRIFFNSGAQSTKIRTIEQWGDIAWQDMTDAFRACSNLTYNADDTPNLSGVTSLIRMFADASAFNGNINDWDVSNITRMLGMFNGASSFNQPLDNWDVSNVTDMRRMFEFATSFNQDISAWDVSQVTDMLNMFWESSSFNQDIGGWDVGQVTIMTGMFGRASSFNADISSWDVSNVTRLSQTFSEASSFNQNIGTWNIGNVTEAFGIFDNSGISLCNFDNILNGWAILPSLNFLVIDAEGLQFSENSADARQILFENWEWSIAGATEGEIVEIVVNAEITGLDVQIEVSGGLPPYIFEWTGPTGFTSNEQNISVTEIGIYSLIIRDADGCSSSEKQFFLRDSNNAFITTWQSNNTGFSDENQILIPTIEGTYDYSVFWEEIGNPENNGVAMDFNGDALIELATAGAYSVEIYGQFPRIFFNEAGDKDKILSIEQWGDIAWTSMEGAFAGCSNLTYNATDIPNLTQVTNMSGMFFEAALFNGNLNDWNVSIVENISNIFRGAVSFNSDLSNWDVSSVTNMNSSFLNASSFDQNLAAWDISNVTDLSEVFANSGLSTANYDLILQGWAA